MPSIPHPAQEPSAREVRRRVAPPIGAIAGAVAGLIVAGLVDLLVSDVTAVAYFGAALLGAAVGVVLALLVPAELDDGHDDDVAAPFGHDARGRADTPVEGAQSRDTR
ncbi:MAG: hypothetical protein QOE10_1138 [Gaiellales bacterium]|nr:hypothetical protein [Gaiellales bacterium]